MQKSRFSLMVLSTVLLFAAAAHADDYIITMQGKKFSPPDLTVPANQKIKLTVKNLDPQTAEFESSDLGREKVVQPNGTITVFIGPLDPGSYQYFNDFNRDMTGTITAK